jgi:hypothetical protein
LADLDQSGFAFQRLNTYLGPSLGWVQTRVKPERFITVGGTYTLTPDDGVVLVNVASAVTLNLPTARTWMLESAYNPATAFERAIWVKDLGGNAAAFNITIQPTGGDQIDTSGVAKVISTAFQILRFYPLSDLTGWFVG